MYKIKILPCGQTIQAEAGLSLQRTLRDNGFMLDMPCGGQGSCGKCKVLVDGVEQLACQTVINHDMMVTLPEMCDIVILTDGPTVLRDVDGANAYALAIDIGTTTVAIYLLDGQTGACLAQAGCLNPQSQYGADVIARLQHAKAGGTTDLQNIIIEALSSLIYRTTDSAGIYPEQITMASIVGNTAMHHLFLGIDSSSLTIPPYTPEISDALELPARGRLPISEHGIIRILPNIAGFVGSDTVGCMVATQFDQVEKLTLLIDVGTNGEMVLGDQKRRVACSTAAGPAFEGAKISCGMRGTEGSIDHVSLENGVVTWHVIGEIPALGLCGSGLLDLAAVLLETGDITKAGYMPKKEYRLEGTVVSLTQKDVRELQLAKAAIRAGIELMCEYLGKKPEDIETVLLAGAFGNYMDPISACRIGMIPPCLINKIRCIGNAAGKGARLCALSQAEFLYSQSLARDTEFLELASISAFQNRFVDCLSFEERDNDA